jgi:exosortase/archaeosortase family protein
VKAVSAATASRWFLVLFLIYLIAGNVLMSLDAVNRWLISPWTEINTVGSARLASLLGLHAVSEGTFLKADAAVLDVEQGCNGFHALLIFACAVLAFPASWASRILGVVTGSVVILGFNLIRLVNLLAIARYAPSHLELFHVYVWQTLIIIVALATFIGWETLIARVQGETRRSVAG